jgi:hypothetical protein
MAERRPRVSDALASIDPPRNFSISTEERVRALAVGVPAYAARKRRIEARALPERECELALLTEARTFDLAAVNRLIEVHNRYYPIEADLPIDPLTGVFLMREEPWQPEPSLSAEGLVASALARVATRAASTP